MVRRRGLVRSVARTAGRTAVIAGTATAVSGRVARAQHQKFAQHNPPPQVQPDALQPARAVGGHDMVGQLQQLADLKASGALTDKEFVAAKTKLLQG